MTNTEKYNYFSRRMNLRIYARVECAAIKSSLLIDNAEIKDMYLLSLLSSVDTVFNQSAIKAAADNNFFPGRLKADIFYQFTVTEIEVGISTLTLLF